MAHCKEEQISRFRSLRRVSSTAELECLHLVGGVQNNTLKSQRMPTSSWRLLPGDFLAISCTHQMLSSRTFFEYKITRDVDPTYGPQTCACSARPPAGVFHARCEIGRHVPKTVTTLKKKAIDVGNPHLPILIKLTSDHREWYYTIVAFIR